MKYGINQFIILTAQPDGGIWDGIVAEIGYIQGTLYRIRPLVSPVRREYRTDVLLNGHLFSDMWVYHDKSRLLNTLLERS